jgi:hypothetical protein
VSAAGRRPGAALWALWVLPLLVALTGCDAGSPVNLGPDPDFLWWTDHETGDLQDWLRDGPGVGSSYASGGSGVQVATGPARSGRFALSSTVPGPGAGGVLIAQVTRTGSLAAAAYYGAWFYVPAFARPATYWVFFAFHGAANAGLWDLKLAATGPDTLGLQLLHRDTGDVTPVRALPVPTGRWFQVQAYYRAAGDAADALRVWQDGVLVFDVEGAIAPVPPAAGGGSWTLGTVSDGLDPGPSVLWLDDAFIATRQIDAHAPPFWRGP